MKQQFLEGKTGTIKLQIYSGNRPVVPSSATITLYKPGSNTPLQAEDTATVDATTGEITYALTATHTATKDLNYKAVWSYVSGGVTYYQNQLFDVVLSILAITIVDEDLYDELPVLRNEAPQKSGTATSGASGSITDTNRKEEDDFWKGGVVEIIAGTGDNQSRDITGFTQSTGVIAVTPNWETAPDSTSIYRITKSFSKQIAASFEKLEQMIYDKGKRHSLIIESSQVKVALKYITLHFICLDLMKEIDDVWDIRATRYWERFAESFGAMKLDYDLDESGGIAGEDEEQANPTGFNISRG